MGRGYRRGLPALKARSLSFLLMSCWKQRVLKSRRAHPKRLLSLLSYAICSALNVSRGKTEETGPPSVTMAAFLAALMIPFYGSMRLTPSFPCPCLQSPGHRKPAPSDDGGIIRQYVADMPYFMTLSLNPVLLGSSLWSISYQPDIPYNLVSPWLSSIQDVLALALSARDTETIAKVFLYRRPRIAVWWFGLFWLGDPSVTDLIHRYLGTFEEKWGLGSLAGPDPMVSAWTKSPQTFLDYALEPYTRFSADDLIPRADLLRYRMIHSYRIPRRGL